MDTEFQSFLSQAIRVEQENYQQLIYEARILEWTAENCGDNLMLGIADEAYVEARESQQTLRWLSSLHWDTILESNEDFRKDLS